MKKLISTITLVVLVTTVLQAQDKGQFSIDLNFQPAAFFDAAASSMFSMPYIKARYFMSDDLAIRAGLGLSTSSSTNYTGANENNYSKNSLFDFSIAPGIEKLIGSEKFFIYLGAEIPFGLSSSKTVQHNANTTDTYINGGYTSIGLNFVIGVDYYIFNSVYIGTEFTPGLVYYMYNDEKTNSTITQKGGTSTSFSLSGASGLRIGFRF